MKTQNTPTWVRRVLGSALALTLMFTSVGNAYALSFIYQDDTFHDIVSEGLNLNSDDGGDEDVTLKFGNDGSDATIVYDDGADFLTIDTLTEFSSTEDTLLIRLDDTDNADSTGIYTGTGDPNASLTAEAGSIFMDQAGALYVNANGGTVWTNVGATGGLDNLDDAYNNGPVIATLDVSDTGYNITSTDGDAFVIQNSGTDIASFSVNATDEAIISFDAAEASDFTVATDAAAEDLTIAVTGATDSSVVISSSGTGTDAIDINATAGDIDIDATGDNGITIDATESSNLTVATDAAAEDLTISVTGATDSSVAITSTGTGSDAVLIDASVGGFDIDGATDSTINTSSGDISIGAGDDLFFDDTHLSGTVQLSVADSDWNATFATDGIIDNINSFALTTSGNGASNVGIFDTATNFTATDVEGALAELAGNDVADGTVTNNTLRWSGSAWVESADFTNDASGNIDAAGTITAGSGDNQITTTAGLLDATVSVITDGNSEYTSTTIDGALDEISTTTGGAIVGIADAGSFYTGVDVEAALAEIDALFGSTDSTSFGFTEDNVLADDDAVYAALDKLDLKWGDLANTANGEGASLVGVEDVGTFFTGTDVEAVLQELGAAVGNNVEALTFEAEYPNTTVFPDGSSNKGLLEVDYDSTAREQYYRWTTKKSADHDIDLRVRYELPADFADTGDLTLDIRTATTTAGDNTVAVIVRNDTDDVTCHSDGAVVGAGAGVWETTTITAAEIETSCIPAGAGSLDPGDIIEIQIKLLADDSSSGSADVGTLTHNYTN